MRAVVDGVARDDETDLIYKTEDAKFSSVVDDITERHEAGQPMLVGTAMTGFETSPATTLGSAPSIPATTTTTFAL